MTELAKHNVPHLIDLFGKVSLSVAILVNLINVCSTFVWNFMDIFIMIVSIGLSSHFQLLNNQLRQATIEVLNQKKKKIRTFSHFIHFNLKTFRVCLKNFG